MSISSSSLLRSPLPYHSALSGHYRTENAVYSIGQPVQGTLFREAAARRSSTRSTPQATPRAVRRRIQCAESANRSVAASDNRACAAIDDRVTHRRQSLGLRYGGQQRRQESARVCAKPECSVTPQQKLRPLSRNQTCPTGEPRCVALSLSAHTPPPAAPCYNPRRRADGSRQCTRQVEPILEEPADDRFLWRPVNA